MCVCVRAAGFVVYCSMIKIQDYISLSRMSLIYELAIYFIKTRGLIAFLGQYRVVQRLKCKGPFSTWTIENRGPIHKVSIPHWIPRS